MKTEIKEKYWLDPSPECRNCGYVMPEQANYCPACSQRNTTGKINVIEFLKEALSNLFNIDAKFFKTLFSFAFPGRLTNNFFQGKHQSFASPIRLFFITIVIFLAALSWSVQDYEMEADYWQIAESKTKSKVLDSIEIYHNNILTKAKTEGEQAIVNSFYQKIVTELAIDTSGYREFDGFRIKHQDLAELSAEEIAEKYKIESLFNRIHIKQEMKLNESPSAFIGFMIGNLTFMFLILIPSLALVLKLLYVRGNWFYVEHLVFLFHYHSFGFFIGTIMFLGHDYFPAWLIGLLGILMGLYLIFSMKNVYQQNWLITILKSFLLAIGYLIFFAICMLFVIIMSFLLF